MIEFRLLPKLNTSLGLRMVSVLSVSAEQCVANRLTAIHMCTVLQNCNLVTFNYVALDESVKCCYYTFDYKATFLIDPEQLCGLSTFLNVNCRPT